MSIYQPDHFSEALRELPSQHREKKSICAFLEGFCNTLQVLEDDLLGLKLDRQVDNALGAHLDQYGSIVGESRLGLEDDEYRRIIKARIPAYRSYGRAEDSIRIASRLFAPCEVRYHPLYPAGYSLHVITDYDPSESARVRMRAIISESSPPGIFQEVILTPTNYLSLSLEQEGAGLGVGTFGSLL